MWQHEWSNRRAPGGFALALGAALLLTAGCGGDGAPQGEEPIVRDSVGIRIITHPGQGSWSPEQGWRLVEELRIGVDAGPPELQFGNVVGVDEGPDGRIYVLDGQARRVRIFDGAGTLVHSFGRGGEGPGEFSQFLAQTPGGVFAGADGTILVPDMGNQRINRFGPDGETRESLSLDLERGFPLLWTRSGDRGVCRQARVMAVPGMPAQDVDPVDRIICMDRTSGAEEVLLEMPPGESFGQVGSSGVPEIRIFAPEVLWTVLDGPRLVTGSNDGYSLSIRDPSSGVETVVRRGVERRPVTPRNESEIRGLFAQAWEEASVPQAMTGPLMEAIRFEPHWPALAQLLSGPDTTLWVQRVDPDASLDDLTLDDLQGGRWGSPRWDVFDAEGGYLGVVEMPERFTPLRFVDDRLYGVHRDELEVQRVVRLRLVSGEEG